MKAAPFATLLALSLVSACALDWSKSNHGASMDGGDHDASGDSPGHDGGKEPPVPCSSTGVCGEHAHCEAGSQTCACDDGYMQQDGVCQEPAIPCSAAGGCGEHAHCEETSQTCACEDGYKQQGGVCGLDLCLPANGGPQCGTNEVCTAADGVASCGCGPSFSTCDASCVDLQNDPAHCGICDFACGLGATCSKGACQQVANSLALMENVSCALLRSDDGTQPLRCWGKSESGLFREPEATPLDDQTLPRAIEGVPTARALALTAERRCALLPDADVLRCWGRCGKDCGLADNYDGSIPYAQFADITVSGIKLFSTTAGLSQVGGATCYTSSLNATVICRGRKDYGAITDGTYDRPGGITTVIEASTPTVTALAGDVAATCAVLSDGEVGCWGINNLLQLGVSGISATSSAGVRVLLQDGSGKLGNVREIDTDTPGACAVTNAGKAYCWGAASNTGNKTIATAGGFVKAVPVDVLQNVQQISVGFSGSCALVSGGQVYCWGSKTMVGLGDNAMGDLSNGALFSTPQKVPGLEHALEVRCGDSHFAAHASRTVA
ncbi:MAG: hypothetical protein QM778_23640 [Myxococcales bacterium]